MGHYGWDGGAMGAGGWVLMAMLMVLFWSGVVLVLVRHSAPGRDDRPTGTAPADSALRVLEDRFARGDIDAEEYTKRRDLLRSR